MDRPSSTAVGGLKWRAEGVCREPEYSRAAAERTAGSLSSGEVGGAASVRWERNEVKWEAVGVELEGEGGGSQLGCGVVAASKHMKGMTERNNRCTPVKK